MTAHISHFLYWDPGSKHGHHLLGVYGTAARCSSQSAVSCTRCNRHDHMGALSPHASTVKRLSRYIFSTMAALFYSMAYNFMIFCIIMLLHSRWWTSFLEKNEYYYEYLLYLTLSQRCNSQFSSVINQEQIIALKLYSVNLGVPQCILIYAVKVLFCRKGQMWIWKNKNKTELI